MTVAAVEPLSRGRRAIARHMSQSKRNVPHFYLLRDVDMTAVERLRATAADEGARAPTITSFVVWACAQAFVRMPELNVTFSEEGLRRRSSVGIGMAVAIEDGLVVPVVADADRLSPEEIGASVCDLAARAREGKLRGSDMSERSAVVSSLGMAGVDAFLPIVNEPDPVIVSVGRIGERWVRRANSGVWRSVATLGLAADHRATDGLQAARFLGEVTSALEDPDVLERAP